MNHNTKSTATESSIGRSSASQTDASAHGIGIAILTVVIAGAASLYFVRPASGESVTVRCERASVIEAGEKRDFRKEKKLAFQRCLDESLVSSQPAH